MNFQIAPLLGQDGITNGAIYALLALSILLVFTVTRILLIPLGEFVTYGALTMAALQAGHAGYRALWAHFVGVSRTALEREFSALGVTFDLWNGESDWRWWAENPSSGAYGIPQSLPASKMATFGSDYRTNPITQMKWGLWYIEQVYGSPCNAYSTWLARSPHWY